MTKIFLFVKDQKWARRHNGLVLALPSSSVIVKLAMHMKELPKLKEC